MLVARIVNRVKKLIKLQKVLVIVGILCLFEIIGINLNLSDTQAVSKPSFDEMLNIVEIPKVNKVGDYINENIYNIYNVFVYSNPEEILNKTNMQRFKEVADKGKYSYNSKRGEFYILGTNYEGDFIYNVYFPVDFIPESLPESWNYIYYPTFEDTWNKNYQYIEQKEYMENSKLMFDRINLAKYTSDSYDLIEYDVIPKVYGLGKFKLNTPATWKTRGVVTAKILSRYNTIRDAFFTTNPMAVDANVKSELKVADNYTMTETEDSIQIEIEYLSHATHLNKYANKEHIKHIEAQLYINGEKVDYVSGSKIEDLDKKYVFEIPREEEYIKGGIKSFDIEVISLMYTDFKVDGLMYDKTCKNTSVILTPRLLTPVINITPKRLMLDSNLLNNEQISNFDFSKYKEFLVVSPLVQTITSSSDGTVGIIERGTDLCLILELGVPSRYIEDITISLNDNYKNYQTLNQDETLKYIALNIDESAEISIATWNSLRDIEGSLFSIKNNIIGKRLKACNKINIKVSLNVNNEDYEYEVLLDVIDDYMKNINYIYNDEIINYDVLSEAEHIFDQKVKNKEKK